MYDRRKERGGGEKRPKPPFFPSTPTLPTPALSMPFTHAKKQTINNQSEERNWPFQIKTKSLPSKAKW